MLKKSERGQMLIVVVLTLIVALTVGLSIASRTVLNLRISRQNEESQRAFQAAEAGVEQILQSGNLSSSDNLQNNASYSTSVSYPSGQAFLLNGGELVDQDTGIDVWLSNYPDYSSPVSGTVTIWWGTDNQVICGPPTGTQTKSSVKSAIEVVVLSNSPTNPTTTKNIYEANGCSRIAAASSPQAGGVPPNTTLNFNNSAQINVTNGLIMRVIPIYNSSKIDVTSNVSLPKQGSIVVSTGKAGDTARKIQYFASYPQVPVEVFPYSLISQ